MGHIENFGGHYKPIELKMCENHAAVLKQGLISPEEYYSEFTTALLDGSEWSWDQCFDTIPEEIDRHAYLKYLRDEIEACDYQPYPTNQVFMNSTEEQIEMVKRELKPQYEALVAFAKRRLS